jgi:hypothetical protein
MRKVIEAINELENLPPEHRASLEVMELRCGIYRKLEKWQKLEWVAEGCLGTDIRLLAKTTFSDTYQKRRYE